MDAAQARDDATRLLLEWSRGDTAAHRVLFDRYHARVASFVRRRVSDPAVCEEVVSDVFFEIWRQAAAYRGESSVPSWIFGIAHFKALGARRFQAQRKRASVVPTADEEMARIADHGADSDFEARDEVRRRVRPLVRRLVERAQADGSLRADFVPEDMPLVFMTGGRVIEASRCVAPDLWRRYLGILLDGLRAEGATPLPQGPLTRPQMDKLLDRERR